MARSKSTPGAKANRTGTDANPNNNNNKEQANTVAPTSLPVKPADLKSAAVKSGAEGNPALKSETKSQNMVAPTIRRLEVAKLEPRKNVVPINLEDEIRRRAYELYEKRGNSAGHETEDWLTAESEVLQRYHHRSA
jgi:hypothetical protein